MAESTPALDDDMDEPISPDMFSDCDVPDVESQNIIESMSTEDEPDMMDDSLEWQGASMNEIRKGRDVYYCQQPPIRSSEHHAVLFELPIPNGRPPKPFPIHQVDKWSEHYVRMPHSSKNSYVTQNNSDERKLRLRWEVIQESLLQSFSSSMQLEAAILSYNNKYISQWNFNALHDLFEGMDEEVTEVFFNKTLPRIIKLALQLPILVTGPIPLLKQHSNDSISLSQLQVASLLANALLCTYPRRNAVKSNSEYASYPHINFNGLFAGYSHHPRKMKVVTEKLKCLIHYFRRVTTCHPEGTITIQRQFIPKDSCPKWDRVKFQLPPLHITSKGTIEDDGAGLLQVDFANKYLGGGVLNRGCVQEEIRFVICPELMVTMLVTEVLDDTEALIVTGAERYSNYTGYSDTFKWKGNHVDETPRDSSGRRKTSIVAIDALFFNQAYRQFQGRSIIRELNKAYVGFRSCEVSSTDLSGIATGNWGCGAFRGDPHLKSLIQLMAAAVNQRPVAYFTFGDKSLRENIAKMYEHLLNHEINVGQLFISLRAYERESKKDETLYDFLYRYTKVKPSFSYFNIFSSPSTKPQTNSQKFSPKKFDTKPATVIKKKKSSVQKNKACELKQEDEIRGLLEQDDDNHDNGKQDSQYKYASIEEDSSDKEESPRQKSDIRFKKHGEKRDTQNSQTYTEKTGDDKKSPWIHFSKNETLDDQVRIKYSRARTGLEELNKLPSDFNESQNSLLTDDSSFSDSDKPPKFIEKPIDVKTMDEITKRLDNKQVDTANEPASNFNNTNNCKAKQSPSPQKSTHKSNNLETGQKSMLDFLKKKNKS